MLVIILNDVHPAALWRKESVTNLMQREHVVNRLVHILPHGKRQETALKVEGRGDRRRMLDGDVFGGQ